MKRFFFAFMTSLSFLSTNSYSEDIDYLQQILLDLAVNEDLFSRANENKQIISSADFIYSVDQALENFVYNYGSLQPYNQTDLLGILQVLLSIGLIKSDGNNGYKLGYQDQITLEILMAGLANDQEKMTQLIEAMNYFFVLNLCSFPTPGAPSGTIDSDIATMTTLSNCLTQLSLDPMLITQTAFVNSLYQAFNNAEFLFGSYRQDLMLFDLDLVGAGLYRYDSNILPPTNLKSLLIVHLIFNH